MPYFLNFNLDTLRNFAARSGVHGDDWRERVFQDLLFRGRLRVVVEQGGDRSSGGRRDAFRLYGRRITALGSIDRRVPTALFVFGLFVGPAAGGEPCPPSAREVEGPWMLLGPNSKADNGQQDVYTWLVKAFVPTEGPTRVAGQGASPGQPAKKIGTISAMAEALLAERRHSADRAPVEAPPTSLAPPSPVVASEPPKMVPDPAPSQSVEAPSVNPLPEMSQVKAEPIAQEDPGVDASELLDVDQAEPVPPSPAPSDEVATPAAELPQVNTSAQAPSSSAAPVADWSSVVRGWTLVRHPGYRPYLEFADPVAALNGERERLVGEIARLMEQLEHLPPSTAIEDLANAERSFLADLPADLARPPQGLATGPSLADLSEALTFRAGASFEALPSWVQDPFGADPVDFLEDDHLVADLLGVLHFVRGAFGQEPPSPALAQLARADGATPGQRLEAAWRDHGRRAEMIAHLGAGGGLEGWMQVPIPQLAAISSVLTRWGDRLSPGARDGLVAQLLPESVENWMEEADPAWAEGLQEPLCAILQGQPTWPLVRQIKPLLLAQSQGQATRSPKETVAVHLPRPEVVAHDDENALLGLSHALSGPEGSVVAPSLYVAEREQDRALSRLRVPVRVRASRPLDGDFIVHLRAEHLRYMPLQAMPEIDHARVVADDDGRLLERVLMVSAEDWDTTTGERDVRTWYLDLVLTVPGFKAHVKSWRQKGLRLDVELKHSSGARARSTLQFADFLEKLPRLNMPETDSTDSNHMRRAPLGVQEGYEALEERVKGAGKSFLVAAPRRFGKTTLLHHLARIAEAQPEVWVCQVALNRSASPRESMMQVLDQLGQSVSRRFQTRPEMPWNEQGVPGPETFDPIRRLLCEKGYRSIMVFVDEAQSLVPRRDGGRWGTELKNLLENTLSREEPDLARMAIVLFGTSALPVRLGDNCRNFLRGKETFSFNEGSLEAFLRQQLRGAIKSTLAARNRLAEAANNLWTLIELVNQIGDIIHEEQRAFFLTSDVIDAVHRLLARNLAESHSSLWSYVSAELNQQDDDWDPIDAYPVALALAADPSDVHSGLNLRDRVIQWLSGFLQREQVFVRIAPERVDGCIDDLKRMHVLRKDGSFLRPLLRAFLRQRAEEAEFSHRADENVLMRLAVDPIRWDPNAVPRSRGGQAEIYVSEPPGEKPKAWRVADLRDGDARRRFMRVCAAIQTLRDVSTRVSGDDFLPAVRLAGLDEDDPNRGVLVYDWIEGEKYQDLRPVLPEIARAHVVMQVARGLEALHSRDVVHRDVHPRNVIVDAQLGATLIDFGMACLVSSAGHTVIPDLDFQAPELRSGALATPASDVYALGAMLVAGSGETLVLPHLQRLYADIGAEQPERRPRAAEVARRLQEILSQSNFRSEQVRAEREIGDVINDAPTEWLLNALLQFQQEAIIRTCYTRWSEQSAQLLSHVLNSLFVAYVMESEDNDAQVLHDLDWGKDRSRRKDPSLAAIGPVLGQGSDAKLKYRAVWTSRGLQVAGHLRNAMAHPADRERKFKLAEKVAPRARHGMFRDELETAAISMDQAFGSAVVHRFAKFFLGPSDQ